MRGALATLFVLGAAAAAPAATITVKPGTPIDTIAAAVEAASPGDTVVVPKGVYYESVNLTGKDGLRLLGKGATWDGNIEGSNASCITGTANDVLVQGFRFRNGTSALAMEGQGIVVTKCTFQGQRGFALEIGGDGSADRAVVSKCRFFGVAGAVRVYGDSVTVERNTFRNLDNNGIDLYGSAATFQGNVVNGINTDSLYVQGADARVLGNRFQNGDGTFVDLGGDRSLVEGNRFTQVDSLAVQVYGSDGRIAANRITATSGNGITVYGSGVTVLGNRLLFCGSEGISTNGVGNTIADNVLGAFFGNGIIAYGSGTTVHLNALSDGDNTAIYVDGPDYRILGNRVQRTSDNGGIYAYDGTSGALGQGLVEGNSIAGTPEWGIQVYGGDVVVRGNTVAGCGSVSTGGIYVYGTGFALESNAVRGAGGTGIFVGYGSSGVTLDACSATDSVLDGILLGTGSGFVLTGCSAKGSGGEGLDNRGTGTSVQGCTFLGNRIDVANDVPNGASLEIDDLTDFGTGGPSTLPEVDPPL